MRQQRKHPPLCHPSSRKHFPNLYPKKKRKQKQPRCLKLKQMQKLNLKQKLKQKNWTGIRTGTAYNPCATAGRACTTRDWNPATRPRASTVTCSQTGNTGIPHPRLTILSGRLRGRRPAFRLKSS